MSQKTYLVQGATPFGQSLIWQMNRDFYQKQGINAWRGGGVPYYLTSSSLVGRTYAELIFAFLKDLVAKGQTTKRVYILELGAGHGQLAFHTLQYLQELSDQNNIDLPPFTYILSDIVESNLAFFQQHDQFQPFFANGTLDVGYFDAFVDDEILLLQTNQSITIQSLEQPLIVLANYFFDSIPSELFHFVGQDLLTCTVQLETNQDPAEMDEATLLKNIETTYEDTIIKAPFFDEKLFEELLIDYKKVLKDTYLFFPYIGMRCLSRLRKLSQKGVLLISMDKGFHTIQDLQNVSEPDMVTHGSMSFWVNFNALAAYAKKTGGAALLPASAVFHVQLACIFLLPESEIYTETKATYHRVADTFGPDDFNSIKRTAYTNIARMSLPELLTVLRLGAYDASLFTDMMPRIKQVAQAITIKERKRLAQTLDNIWHNYFALNDKLDLAYEIGGMLYDLGFYADSLRYFDFSVQRFGEQPDTYYNQALSYYNLRQDDNFLETLKLAKAAFPDYVRFGELEKLDLNAA